MNENQTTSQSLAWKRGFQVLLFAIFAVSITGFFVGLHQTRQASQPAENSWQIPPQQEPVNKSKGAVPIVVDYKELPKSKIGPNRNWQSSFTRLETASPKPPKKAPAEVEIKKALKERADRRAFLGAPPVIPHPITELSSTSCMVCHEKGLVIDNKITPKISHPFYANCTQCHIAVGGKEEPTFLVANSFKGLKTPAKGERSFPKAPPLIPHPTLNSSDCLSCHGPTGTAAFQTTHPERQSCFQCHLKGSPLDRPAFLTSKSE